MKYTTYSDHRVWKSTHWLYSCGWKPDKIAAALNLPPGTVYGWVIKGKTPRTKANIAASPELSYFVGAWLGDGSSSLDHKRKISLVVKDKDFATEFARCASVITGKDYPISTHKYGFQVQVYSKFLFDKLKNWESLEHKLAKYPKMFLRGLADAEGSVHKAGRRKCIIIS